MSRRGVLMSIIEVFAGIRQWVNQRQFEHDMDDEMRFHIDMETRDLAAHGMAEREARAHALRTFGGATRFKEEARVALPLHWLADLRTDLRYALRSLRRTPVFTSVAVLALGIGIGANATLFGLADAVAFRPLGVDEPEAGVAASPCSLKPPHSSAHPMIQALAGTSPAFLSGQTSQPAK